MQRANTNDENVMNLSSNKKVTVSMDGHTEHIDDAARATIKSEKAESLTQ